MNALLTEFTGASGKQCYSISKSHSMQDFATKLSELQQMEILSDFVFTNTFLELSRHQVGQTCGFDWPLSVFVTLVLA